MNPPLPERLAQSLLAEMVSGNYEPGNKFLSHRKILAKWKVSTPTANKALKLLDDWQLLEKKKRSGHYLKHNFRERAFLKLNRSTKPDANPLGMRPHWHAKITSFFVADRPLERIAVIIMLSGINTAIRSLHSHREVFDIAASQTARGIFNEARKDRVMTDFFLYNGDAAVKEKIINEIMHSRANGVIIVRRIFSARVATLANSLLIRKIPVIAVYDDCEHTEMISLNFNNVGIGYTVGCALLEKGHSRIGVLLRPERVSYFRDRLQGCRIAARERAGCIVTPLYTDLSIENLQRTLREIIEKEVSALFVVGEELLAAMGPHFKRAKIRIPRDLSIVICSSTATVAGFQYPFDLIRCDFEQMGRNAFRALGSFYSGETSQRSIIPDITMESHGTLTIPKFQDK